MNKSKLEGKNRKTDMCMDTKTNGYMEGRTEKH